jgi:hypothetical protein
MPNFLALSENGLQVKFGMNEFSSLFETQLFESESDNMLLEKAYATYELGLLFENRRSWFKEDDESPIYMLEGDGHRLLFKDNNMFIITESSYNMLNEGWFSDAFNWAANKVSQAVTYVKQVAVQVVNKVVAVVKDTWDTLSKWAKQIYAFGKRIASAILEFAKSEPLECVGIILSIVGSILSFFPVANVWLGPILMAVGGGIEIYSGFKHLKEGYRKIANVSPSDVSGGAAQFSQGIPLVVAGLISSILGLHDIIKAPLAGTGAGPISKLGAKKVAEAWGETFVAQTIHNSEHYITNVVGNLGTKLQGSLGANVGKFIAGKAETIGSAAPGLVSALFVIIGKHILGGLWNSIVSGLATITQAFSWFLSLPTKLSDAIQTFRNEAESTGAKIVASALGAFIQPASKAIGKFLDKNIRPSIDAFGGWMKTISVNYKQLSEAAEDKKVEVPSVAIKPQKIKTKEAQEEKGDKAGLKKLPDVTDNVKKVVKDVVKDKGAGKKEKSGKDKKGVKESINYIKRFGEFSMV